MTPYQFAISNVKQHLRSEENMKQVIPQSVFDVAPILAIAFMKLQEDVISDLIAR